MKPTFSWVRAAKRVIISLTKIKYFDEVVLNKFVIYHIIDILTFNEKKILLKVFSLYNNEETKISREDKLFYDHIGEYFKNNKIENEGLSYFILRNDDDIIYKFKLLTFNNDTKKIDEINMVASILKKIKYKFKLNSMDINELFGFLSKFKNSNRYVFKIKKIKGVKNNTGRKCGGNKSELIKIVNNLYSTYFTIIEQPKDKERYFKSENSLKYNKINNFDDIDTILKLDPIKLCIEIELLFRYLDYDKRSDKKRFFFSTIEENIYNLKKIPLNDETTNIFFN